MATLIEEQFEGGDVTTGNTDFEHLYETHPGMPSPVITISTAVLPGLHTVRTCTRCQRPFMQTHRYSHCPSCREIEAELTEIHDWLMHEYAVHANYCHLDPVPECPFCM